MISEMTTGCLCSDLSYVCKNNEKYVTSPPKKTVECEGRELYIIPACCSILYFSLFQRFVLCKELLDQGVFFGNCLFVF